jgi:hypothetical protein
MRCDDGEGKILRELFGPVEENYVWEVCTNQDLIDWQRKPDFVPETRNARL